LTILPQIFVSGLAQGSLYALAALGIVVIFNASQVVNFAHGAMAALTAYVTWSLLGTLHVPYPLAVLAALIVAFGVGYAIEAVLLRRVVDAPPLTQIVVTLGLLMFFTGAIGLAFGYNPHSLPPLVNFPSLAAGPVLLLASDAFQLVVLVLIVAALLALFRRTRIGLAMRALTQDLFASRLAGIPIGAVLSVAWGIGIALAGVAGILAVPKTTLTPAMMDTLVIYGFVAAVLGGFGTIWGAVFGGLVLGVVDNLIKTYLAPELSLTAVFALLLAVLYVRPNGIFGREATRKV
jgi:branched-chain amino acid transport system permease protein